MSDRQNWSDPARYLGFNAPFNAHARWGRKTYLYFIGHGALTKIGIAADLEARLKALRAGNPDGLRVLAYRRMPAPLDRQIERRMHSHFSDLAAGREWFRDLPLKDALRVAGRHIRQGELAIRRWEADGFWNMTAWSPEYDAVAAQKAELEARMAASREYCREAIARLRQLKRPA